MSTDAAPLYLAIDQGGHASRALAIDGHGEIVADAFVDIATTHPAPDRVEHDAAELADSLHLVCRELVAGLGSDRHRLRAAGLATQRSSIVCWDRTNGAALSPVLSWQDRRAAASLDQIKPEQRYVEDRTGLVLSPHYGATKMRWCLDNLTSLHTTNAAGRLAIGPLASFLVANLVSQIDCVADPANASRTLLWDRHERRFSTRLCALFGVPPAVLPTSVPSRYNYGDIVIGDVSVPLRVVTGDQSAALFAFGQPKEDHAYINMGTGAFFQRPVGREPVSIPGLLSSVIWQSRRDVRYVVEGTVNGAASALHHCAQGHRQDAHALLAEAITTHANDASTPVFLNGVGGLAAPFWLSDFRSQFIGDGGPAMQMLAVAQSIAFLLALNIRHARKQLGDERQLVLTGGLAGVDYLCAAIAHLCGTATIRARSDEATARGLAYLVAGRPADWPAPVALRHFEPTRDDHLSDRFRCWQQAMAQHGAHVPDP